ncbi:MAG: rhodanese-like domain-containing protein [Bacteroidales bacterium]|nr:rhodanese-like domain-containing protein [Bacteroidales bacterium]
MNKIQANILKNATLLFAIVGIMALLVQWIAAPDYKAENEAVLSTIANDDQKILPLQLHEMITTNQLANYTLVDLRSSHLFNVGTLSGAINIPFADLLKKGSLKQMKKHGNSVLLFSDDESQAVAAAVLLISKGFDDVKTLANDYDYIKKNVLETFDPASAFSKSEKARFDYNRFFRTGGGADGAPVRTQPKIIQTEIVKTHGAC